MSSKVVSYFDWEMGFKKNNVPEIKNSKKISLNSIGMNDADFRRHLEKWKNKNL
jgi:hypothetical protein